MIISTEFNQDTCELLVSYYDQNGQVAYIRKYIHDVDQYNWVLTPSPTEYRNWDNRFLKKSKSKWLSRFRLEELIQERFTEEELALIYSNQGPQEILSGY